MFVNFNIFFFIFIKCKNILIVENVFSLVILFS